MREECCFTVRCWYASAEGEYEFKVPTRLDAILKAREQFREDCISAASFDVPRIHEISAQVIGAQEPHPGLPRREKA